MLSGRIKYSSRAGILYAQERLHHLGCAAYFVSNHATPIISAQLAMQRLLDRVRLGFVSRLPTVRKTVEPFSTQA
jgi:hypothetical protein